MNKRHLDSVIAKYIEKFAWLNEKDGHDESYKWIAVKNFQSTFDVDAPDFYSMLLKSCKATENLIDSNQQPFRGLCKYAEYEPETVREMFKVLLEDDGGNLAKRQEKIDEFLKRAEKLRQKYFPSSHLFKNDQRTAMAYLWFYDPDNHYYCKTTEAQQLANCVEFYDDWGTYETFKLNVYHRFCDEIIAHIKENKALIETHNSRFKENEDVMHEDKELHILLVDIIFCAIRYALYEGITFKDFSAKAKKLYQENRAIAEEKARAVATAEENVILLDEVRRLIAELMQQGVPILHRKNGKAKFIRTENNMYVFQFDGINGESKFGLSAIVNGFIRIDTPDINLIIEKYRYVMEHEYDINRKLEIALADFRPYEQYVQ